MTTVEFIDFGAKPWIKPKTEKKKEKEKEKEEENEGVVIVDTARYADMPVGCTDGGYWPEQSEAIKHQVKNLKYLAVDHPKYALTLLASGIHASTNRHGLSMIPGVTKAANRLLSTRTRLKLNS